MGMTTDVETMLGRPMMVTVMEVRTTMEAKVVVRERRRGRTVVRGE